MIVSCFVYIISICFLYILFIFFWLYLHALCIMNVSSCAGQVELTDLKERIVEVSQNVTQLKHRVHDHMKSKFVDFDPLLKKIKGFLEKAVRTSDEINTLFNRIEFQVMCRLLPPLTKCPCYVSLIGTIFYADQT